MLQTKNVEYIAENHTVDAVYAGDLKYAYKTERHGDRHARNTRVYGANRYERSPLSEMQKVPRGPNHSMTETRYEDEKWVA